MDVTKFAKFSDLEREPYRMFISKINLLCFLADSRMKRISSLRKMVLEIIPRAISNNWMYDKDKRNNSKKKKKKQVQKFSKASGTWTFTMGEKTLNTSEFLRRVYNTTP